MLAREPTNPDGVLPLRAADLTRVARPAILAAGIFEETLGRARVSLIPSTGLARIGWSGCPQKAS